MTGSKPIYNPYRHAQCLKNGGHEWETSLFMQYCSHCGRKQSIGDMALIVLLLVPFVALWVKLKRIKERVIG